MVTSDSIRARVLGRNTAAFAVSSLTAQVVGFLMIPFLTDRLTPSQFGIADLVMTFSAIAATVASFGISEAVLRFGMDDRYVRAKVLGNALVVALAGFGILLLLVPLLRSYEEVAFSVTLGYLVATSTMIREISGQFLRALNRIDLVVVGGVAQALILAGANLLLVGLLDLSLVGYLLALLISIASVGTAQIVYSVVAAPARVVRIDAPLLGSMLKYSIPLMPNGLLWWAVSFASRLILLGNQGTAAVGLFAVASRIPSLLALATQVFWQAWQLSAIEERDALDRKKFQSDVFVALSAVLFLFGAGVLAVLKEVMSWLVAEDFYSAWEAVPPLLLSTIFLAFASFIGTEFKVRMKTWGALTSSAVAAIATIALSLAMVPSWSVIGAALATCLGYLVMWLVRVRQLGDPIVGQQGHAIFWVSLLLITVQSALLYVDGIPTTWSWIINLSVVLALLIISWPVLRPVLGALGFRSQR